MTLPKKGLRLVRLGEHEYAWRIRKKPTYLQGALQTPMRVAIQQFTPPAPSVLIVNLVISRPDNWISPHQTAITPALIREIITSAIDAGWDPASTKAFPFEFGAIRDQA